MFVLMLDDGSAFGPFETAEEAVRCDLTSMSIYSLPLYQERACRLNDEWVAKKAFDPDSWAEATALVEEVDHLIIRFELVAGKTMIPGDVGAWADLFDDGSAIGSPNRLRDPQALIDGAKEWAKGK